MQLPTLIRTAVLALMCLIAQPLFAAIGTIDSLDGEVRIVSATGDRAAQAGGEINEGESFIRNPQGEVAVKPGQTAFVHYNGRVAPKLLARPPAFYQRHAEFDKRVAARRQEFHRQFEEQHQRRLQERQNQAAPRKEAQEQKRELNAKQQDEQQQQRRALIEQRQHERADEQKKRLQERQALQEQNKQQRTEEQKKRQQERAQKKEHEKEEHGKKR